MFDAQKSTTLEGTVKEFQWTNPHSWILLMVNNAEGQEVQWAIEMGGPAGLARQGWRPKTLTPGMKVKAVIHPLRDGGNGLMGVSVSFLNVTTTLRLQDDLQRAHQELEAAYEELQSSNEELETTNEELQSTVEDLETTNEELQSTNEELETMNEEMHSANEELQTINEELRQRSDDLNQVNTFLESILASFRGGVAVVDRDLLVLVWNHRAEDLWGLRAEEAEGKNFLNLDIGLPVEQLRQVIRTSLTGEGTPADLMLEAVNRRGKPIRCRVNSAPLFGPGGETRGVILLMEEPDKTDGREQS